MEVRNRFAPTAGVTASVASTATQTLFTGAANANGAYLLSASIGLNATVATASQATLRTIAAAMPILGGRIEAGAIQQAQIVLPAQVYIPAGIGVELFNSVSPANTTVMAAWQLL